MLKRAHCDLLIILDCCYAANAAQSSIYNANEFLVACGKESESERITDFSFTRNLMRKLNSFGNVPFTVKDIYHHLLKDRKRLKNTPVYTNFSAKDAGEIVLRPFKPY